MARHPDFPVKSATRDFCVGVVSFTTASTSTPTSLTDDGGGAVALTAANELNIVRTAQGRFLITFDGPYKKLRGFANAVARDTERAQCGAASAGSTLEVSVLNNLGAEVDTTGLRVDVLYALQR